MAKAKSLNGKDLMLWVDGMVVALSTSCKLTLQAETEDSGTKDDGSWKAPDITGMSWSMSNESLAAKDERTSDLAFAELYDKMINGEPVEITFGIPTNLDDAGLPEDGWTNPSETGYKGKAIITQVDYEGAKGSKAKITVSLEGYGPLTKQTKKSAA